MRKFLLPVIAALSISSLAFAQVGRGPISRALQQILAIDGTSAAPSLSFASEPTLGFYRSASGVITAQGGNLVSTATMQAVALAAASSGSLNFLTRGFLSASADGNFVLRNNALTIGSTLKTDALPTAGTCGTSPAITAGSTPLAGSINVGTGGTATTCGVTFNGTAYPSAPFCSISNQTSNSVTRYSTSTTVLTLNTTTAWTASDIVSWICISPK